MRINTTVINNRKWIEHYKELLIEDRTEYMHEKDTLIKVEGEEVIIVVKMVKRAARFKNGKATRPEGISAKLTKNDTGKLFRLLTIRLSTKNNKYVFKCTSNTQAMEGSIYILNTRERS